MSVSKEKHEQNIVFLSQTFTIFSKTFSPPVLIILQLHQDRFLNNQDSSDVQKKNEVIRIVDKIIKK